ncbi:hypothetical protein F5880DRAFT_1616950 [Lentinula raphanica]|nr:hypothetical protein F5880DRAFT_1616950 [Lentinula raphanica]
MTKSLEFGKVLDGMVREKGTGAGGVLSKEKDEWEWEVYERIKLGGAVIPEDTPATPRYFTSGLESATPRYFTSGLESATPGHSVAAPSAPCMGS